MDEMIQTILLKTLYIGFRVFKDVRETLYRYSIDSDSGDSAVSGCLRNGSSDGLADPWIKGFRKNVFFIQFFVTDKIR